MDHWRERTEYGAKEIVLKDEDRVVSIASGHEGEILIGEECDSHFGASYTRTEAIALLREAIDWIKNLP